LIAAMIVKNEVQTLERTVNSVREYVDRVVIGVDEQSDDGTRELAERLADEVIPIQLSEELARKAPVNGGTDWGFSRARNLVLDACPEGWRLILDGHEVVHGPENLKKAVEEALSGGCDGASAVIHFEPDAQGIPRRIYRQPRLLAPPVRYNNPIHNVPVIKNLFKAEGLVVEHRKMDQNIGSKVARDAQRSDSSINGLKKKVSENPGEPRALFYLGNAYKENARWRNAIDIYKEHLKVAFWNEERWHSRVNMGVCYRAIGDEVNARDQISRAIDEFPSMVEAYYILADIAYKQQKFREAQVWLERCIGMDIPDCMLFVNPRTYLVDRYDLLAMTYSHLGEHRKAIDIARKALEAAPNERIENNISAWVRHLGGENAV